MEFSLKQAYQNKITTCLNNANMNEGININELIDRCSDVTTINQCWHILTQFNNFNQATFLNDVLNNVMLIKNANGENDLLDILISWIELLNKTFIKCFKAYINNVTKVKTAIDKDYLFEIHLKHKVFKNDKSLSVEGDEIVKLFNDIFKRKAKNISAISSSSIDLWNIIRIDNDKTTDEVIYYKLV